MAACAAALFAPAARADGSQTVQTLPRVEIVGTTHDNVLDRKYATAAQLGATAFDSSGRFVAQPFPVNSAGDYPLRGSTFFAPGSPRLFTVCVRYRFD
ncbi:MAG: hypothetical protein M3Y55_13395 [Pseudomonadota bacterium]|nr:hypothetical protein [Pseudomonadota bacterium]